MILIDFFTFGGLEISENVRKPVVFIDFRCSDYRNLKKTKKTNGFLAPKVINQKKLNKEKKIIEKLINTLMSQLNDLQELKKKNT